MLSTWQLRRLSVFVERLAKECKTLGSLWTKACCGENNSNNRVAVFLLSRLLTLPSIRDESRCLPIVYVAISLQSPDSSRFTARIRLGSCYTIIDTSQVARHREVRAEGSIQLRVSIVSCLLSVRL
jgi:hypothetical protein